MKLSNLVLAGLILAFASCSKDKTFDERELHLMSPEKIAGFDPIQVSDRYSAHENGKVYEGLFEFHPLKRPYELVPNLAESMPTISADGLTYTFKIKQGVLFHESPVFKGQPRVLKTDDIFYSLRRLADPKLSAKGWWIIDDKIAGLNEWRAKYEKEAAANYDEAIEGLVKIDDHTFQIKLKRPFPQFLYSLAMPYTFIVAKEVVEFFGKEFLNHPVGTGPFTLDKFEQSNRIVYHRNAKFRDKFYPAEGAEGDDKLGLLADAGKKLPLVDKVIVDIMPVDQTQWLNFQKGRVDLMEMKSMYERALDDNNQLHGNLKSNGVRLHIDPMLDVTFVSWNYDNPLLKNKKLRQAMSLAFDRAGYNRLFYKGLAAEAQSVIPPGLAGYRKEFRNPYTKFDIAAAKKLLAEAGHPGGKGLEFTIETRADTIPRQQIEFIAKNMAEIGIKIKVGTNTWPELIKKVSTRQNQGYTMAWGADYPDAENFLGLLYCPNSSPGSNGANYCNPDFDALFKTATQLQDSPERTAMYEKLNEMVALDSPWIFGFHRPEVYVSQAWLKNFKQMEFNHSQFQYLGVDLEVKKELSKKF
ncbi:MAG: ABC transporter substrate-binding protein [Bacteriovoracaceae bacterium]